jgi:hypothetical protein
MPGLRMLSVVAFVAMSPFLTSATQISGLGDTTSVPTLLSACVGSPKFQWSMPPDTSFGIADKLINTDTDGSSFLPVLFSSDPAAGENDDAAASMFGESQPGSRLTFTISIFVALGLLLKGFPSSGVSNFGGYLMLQQRADSTLLSLVSILYSTAVFFLKLRRA